MTLPSAPPSYRLSCLLRTLVFMVLVSPALAACSWFGSDGEPAVEGPPQPEIEAEAEAPPEPEIVCPQPGFPQDLDRVAVFLPGREPYVETLVTMARFDRVEGACGPEEEDGRVRLHVEFELSVLALKGPAFDPETDDEMSFPYFVALIGPDDRVRWREEGVVELDFPSSRVRTRNYNTLDHEIYIDDVDNAGEYAIYAGFLLTREQLAYNQREILAQPPQIDLFRD